jgi:lipopolysaccharide transport protein LptA
VHQIRFLRILLPLLLAALGVVLWMSWDPRGATRGAPAVGETESAPRATDLSFVEYKGSSGTVMGSADLLQPADDGSLHMEGIRDLAIEREEREPLIVSASSGDRQGPPGSQRWQFEEQVVARERESGLALHLPSLEVDQASGEARSSGDIRFEAPNLRGGAGALRYSLTGGPGELSQPSFHDAGGGSVSADRAVLLDGIRDVELLGHVQARQGSEQLEAGRLRLVRDERLRRATAGEGVRGTWPVAGGPPVSLQARELDVQWDEAGNPVSFTAAGNALVRQGTESLAASSIVAERRTSGAVVWQVEARESVSVQGAFGESPGLLRARFVQAGIDAAHLVREARAEGQVTYEARDVRAEAERATWGGTGGSSGGRIHLFGDARRKARLAQGPTRVAAESIETDARGERLEALGRVEATLLPDERAANDGGRVQLFAASEAVHFVSDRLDSSSAGKHLVFAGTVRGWQGERNLAASTVVVDQTLHTLEARDGVTTRFPREAAAAAVSADDYVQILSDALDYDGAGALAVYRGQVRVRFAEGWLEAQRVEVDLGGDERRIREVRAFDDVRLEVHRTAKGSLARPMAGASDRLVYTPPDATLVLFGDRSPASVRRAGDGGGTTTGRVLTYRLDTGTLDVDSGGRGPGRIVTPEGGG